MLTLFRAGGVPMFFILAFGLLSLVSAARFAYNPAARLRGIAEALSRATLFSVATGICAALGAVFQNVPNNEEWAHSPDLHLVVMVGLGESMAPGVMGFSLLSLTWLLLAVGARREV